MTRKCSAILKHPAAGFVSVRQEGVSHRVASLLDPMQQTCACTAEFAMMLAFWLCACLGCAAAEADIARLACSSFMSAVLC